MSTKRCYYETLEVERNADESKLKAAFRKLAMKWHPDRNPGDATSEVRFKEINEAYEVLKDGDKRAAYDRFGHAAFEQGGVGPGGPGFGAGFATSFSDIFEDLFGMAGQRGRGAAGRHDRQRMRERGGGVLGLDIGELDVEAERLGAVIEQIAIAEQVEWRKFKLIAAQPGLDGDVGPDACRFAQCQRERLCHQRYSIIAALRISCR